MLPGRIVENLHLIRLGTSTGEDASSQNVENCIEKNYYKWHLVSTTNFPTFVSVYHNQLYN